MRRKIPTCAFILGLASCTVGPDFTPPKPPDITKWKDRSAQPSRPTSPVSTQTNPDPNWWNGFKDPTLATLIQKAISGNLTLQQAVVRIVEAQQGEVSARAAGLPAVNGSGSYM
jgi:outer membrane protein, multidrug efflux system